MDIYEQQFSICEKENIRQTGNIQSGFRLVVMKENEIVAYSENIEQDDLDEIKNGLLSAIPLEKISERHKILIEHKFGKWIAHSNGEYSIYENIINHPSVELDEMNWESISSSNNTWKLSSILCRELRFCLSASRVMVYKFDKEYCGEVIAESIESGLEPFIGLKYPPTDIPKIARDLFLEIGTRQIFSIKKSNIKILSLNDEQVDIRHAISRSVSPYHIEYLKNMGSESTATISLIYQGKLWGLISIHYRHSIQPTIEETSFLKETYEKIGEIFTKNLNKENEEKNKRTDEICEHFREELLNGDNLVKILTMSKYSLHKLVHSHGVTILTGDTICNSGVVPDSECILKIVKHYSDSPILKPQYFNTLDEKMIDRDKMNGVAGLVLIKMSSDPFSFVLIYRIEVNLTVSWGGDPRKSNIEIEEKNLIPRKSFLLWSQILKNHCREWSIYDKEIISNIVSILLDFYDVPSKKFIYIIAESMEKMIEEFDIIHSSVHLNNNTHSGVIFVVNSAENKVFLNQSATEILGILNARVTFNEFAHSSNVSIDDCISKENITIFTENYGEKYYSLHQNLIIEMFNINSSENKKRNVMIEFRDITNENRVKNTLEYFKNKSQKEEKFKDEFYAKLNHELRTPLSVIIGFSQLLLKKDATNDTVKKIVKYANSMRDIIDSSLFRISSPFSMNQKDFSDINVYNIIEDCVEMTADTILNKNLSVELDDFDKDLVIYSHTLAIKQIVINLLTNAIKYNVNDGKITFKSSKNNYDTTIFISDTGIGMSKEEVDTCMQAFKRHSIKDVRYGLGLSIVSNILELLGGNMKIESVKDKGTTFIVSVPNKINSI